MQEKRLNEIQNYLKNHEICTYEELREYCDVSLSTIKRDIDFLDAERTFAPHPRRCQKAAK